MTLTQDDDLHEDGPHGLLDDDGLRIDGFAARHSGRRDLYGAARIPAAPPVAPGAGLQAIASETPEPVPAPAEAPAPEPAPEPAPAAPADAAPPAPAVS